MSQRSSGYQQFVNNYLPRYQGKLEERLTEGNARKISKTSMTRWEEELAGPLELTRTEIEDINDQSSRPALKRFNVLMAWKDNKSVAKADTYGNLVDACLKGGDSRTAITICEVLKEEAQSAAPPQANPSQQPNPQGPYYGGNAQPPPQGYQAQPYGPPPGAYQPYGGGQPRYHPPQQQQQQQQQHWAPQQQGPPQSWGPQQPGPPPQQQGGYHQGPPQSGHYPPAQSYSANVPNESNSGGPNKDVAGLDHELVTKYLVNLSNQEIINIGLKLGLDYSRLNKKRNSESLMDDMVQAWLRKDDHVREKSGEPSWKTLCTALKACGHTGIAMDMEKKGAAPPQANPSQQSNPQGPYYGGNAQPPPQGYQAQPYGPPPGAYQPYGGGQPPPQQQQQQEQQQHWGPQQQGPPQSWGPQQPGPPQQQQQQNWAPQQPGPPQQQQQQQQWASQQPGPPQNYQQGHPPQQPYNTGHSGQQPNSGQGQGPNFDSAPSNGQQPPSTAIESVKSIPPQDLQPVAMFDYFEKGTVDSDGGSKVMQYEAAPRGQHIPQLKLHDGDQVSTIRAKPVRVTHQDLGYYPMNNVLHGIALIINNQHFTDLNHRERVGTARDEYNLKQTFLYLGYRPVVCNDLTKAEITYIFKNLDNFLRDSNNKAQNKVANDSFVCCILSHGNKGVIITSDSQALNREDIETMVGTCKTLQGKPKMFFIQACQGDSYGTVPIPRVSADDTTSVRADFYLCFATVHGDKSYRDKFTGSWFITEVCKVLCEHATSDIVNNEFQLRLNGNVTNNPVYRYHRESEKKTYTQQPSCSNQLQRSIHFFFSGQN